MAEATILCIDDDIVALAALIQRLEAAHYTVIRVSSVDQAELLYDDHLPDLVLLEPGADRGRGWQVLEQLVGRGARVFVVSSQGLEEDILRGFALGAVDYLARPYRTAELLARVELRLRQSVPERAMGPLAAEPPASEADPLTDESAEPPAELTAPNPWAAAVTSVRQASAKEAAAVGETPASLGGRLRASRKGRNISLVQAELDTRIRMYYLQALEEERFALLPRGQATEQIIRDYVTYLGMDAAVAVAEYRQAYRAEDAPLNDLNGGLVERRRGISLTLILLTAVLALLIAGSALLYFAPEQLGAIWLNVRELVVAPSAAPATTPTP